MKYDKTPIQKKILIICVLTAIGTGWVLRLFNSGKFIEIPRGTHEGMAMSVVVYLVIMVSMSLMGFVVFRLVYYLDKKKSK